MPRRMTKEDSSIISGLIFLVVFGWGLFRVDETWELALCVAALTLDVAWIAVSVSRRRRRQTRAPAEPR
jgi:hypothetical protein